MTVADDASLSKKEESYSFSMFFQDLYDKGTIPKIFIRDSLSIPISDEGEYVGNSLIKLKSSYSLAQINIFHNIDEAMRKRTGIIFTLIKSNEILDFEIINLGYNNDASVFYDELEKEYFQVKIFDYTGSMPHPSRNNAQNILFFKIDQDKIMALED